MSADEDSDLEILPNPADTTKTVDLSNAEEGATELATLLMHETSKPMNAVKRNSWKRRIQLKTEPRSAPPKKKRRVDTDCENEDRVEETASAIKSETGAECIDMSKQHVRRAASNPHHFWGMRPGLNYAGQCMNASCVAHTEPVMIMRGFGAIEPIYDIERQVMKCPGCSEVFSLDAIYLNKARVHIRYHIIGETKAHTQIVSLRDQAYQIFGEKYNERKRHASSQSAVSSTRGIVSGQDSVISEAMYKVLTFNVQRHGQ